MKADYAELEKGVTAAGFFTTFMPIEEVGDRIVCASRQYTSGPRKGGLCGNSFWDAKRGDDWFVATWVPVNFRMLNVERLVELCTLLLDREPAGAYSRIDEKIQQEFGLVEIADEDFPE
jgi:hypothetical protein